MKTFIINLEKDINKKKYMSELCEKANLDFNFVPAIDGKKLIRDEISKYISAAEKDSYFFRELTRGEIGTALSHLSIYRKIVDEGYSYSLILEDDIVFTRDFNDVLNSVSDFPKNWDIILLGHHAGHSRSVEAQKSFWSRHRITKKHSLVRFVEITYGAYGYLISYQGAKKLASLFPINKPIDHYTGSEEFVNLYGISPICVDLAPDFFEASNLSEERNNIELLANRILNLNMSPFSKGVRLVKKKILKYWSPIKPLKNYK